MTTTIASTVEAELRDAGRTHAPRAEPDVLRALQADLAACRKAGVLGGACLELIPKWRRMMAQEPSQLFRKDQTLNEETLRQFRRRERFLTDLPGWDPQAWSLVSLLGGGRRGVRQMLEECLEIVRRSPAEPLLRAHPSPTVGEPFVVRRSGYVYTYRWLKHIWSLGLAKGVLGRRLARDFVGLDIGSGYGIFSGLLKREWPDSHQVLVDFPEQLLKAGYFLGRWLPGCRVAGMRDVLAQAHLTREWVRQYDVVLVPCPWYGALAGGVADLVTNFASFGEMTRTAFEGYVGSAPFRTARYVFLANRIQSRPTYDTDVTILDYPIWNPAQRLHFGLSPVFSRPYRYRRRCLFFSMRSTNNPYFDYIGDQAAGTSR